MEKGEVSWAIMKTDKSRRQMGLLEAQEEVKAELG